MNNRYTAFRGSVRIAQGTQRDLVSALGRHEADVLVFDDQTGKVVDLDWREQHRQPVETPPRKRGRPKLGVIPREVTLLPRQWDWLNQQPGGASQALRRLIDEARKADGGRTARRTAHERAYRFMSAIAGDLPDFEQACRLLFADDMEGLTAITTSWPGDISVYVYDLLHGSDDGEP